MIPGFSKGAFAPSDWQTFLREFEAQSVAEIDLRGVKSGDRLLVLTEQTAYSFVLGPGRTASLTTNREDRPTGAVTINGCTIGASSSIKPDQLFCGGNLEFTHGDGHQVYTTTTIRALQLLQAQP